MPFIFRPGATINFEVWGGESGPWVTLINGHLRPLNDFRMLAQKLIRKGYRVIALDNRGAGQTMVTESFSLQDLVQDIIALWDEVGCQQSLLLGISMGGFVALELALEYPSRIRKLIVVSSASSALVLNAQPPSWDSSPEKVQEKLRRYFAEAYVRKNPLILQGMAKQMAKTAENGDLQYFATLQRKAVENFNATTRLSDIGCPTLIIHGKEDVIIPAQEGEYLAAHIPKSQLLLMPDTGHLILAEQPVSFFEAITNFLSD